MKNKYFLGCIFLYFIMITSCLSFDKRFEEFTYNTYSEGITIFRYIGRDKDIIIPSQINGINVVSIYSLTESRKLFRVCL